MRPAHRRMKRVFVRVPSGEVRVRVKKRKPGKHVCAICGRQLHGVPHGRRPVEVRKLSKTERRPEVPFGGVLCSECRRRVIQEASFVRIGAKKIEDVPISIRQFVLQALNVVEVG